MAQAEIFTINVQPIVDQMKVLGTAIGQTKDQLSKLTEEEKKNTDEGIALSTTLKAQQKEYNSLSTVVTNQKSAVNELSKATKSNTDLMDLESNSIATNRKLYNALYGEIVNTTAATDAEKKALNQKIETAKKVNDVLKNQEKALGDTRRNVGNYAESIKGAFGELVKSNTGLQTMTQGLQGAKAGFVSAGGGVKGFAMALATTGLPLIIMGVQALINVFKEFKPVADGIEDVVNGIKDAFGALINGGSMQETIRAGNQLVETYRDLEDTAGGYNIQVSKTKGQIDRLVISAKDLGKTEEERKKLLEQAGDLEKNLFDESLKRNSEKLISERNNLLEKTKLTKRELDLLATGADADNEDFQRIKDKFENVKGLDAELLTNYQKTLLERQDLQNDSNKFQEKIVNASNKIIEKQQGQEEKAQAKRDADAEKRRQKKEADDAKALADKKAYDAQILALEDEFQKSERDRLEDSFQKKQDLVKGNTEAEIALRLLIGQQQIQALKKFDEERAKQVEDARKKVNDQQIAIDAETFNKQVALNDKLLQNDLDLVDLSVDSEENKNKRKQEIQIKYLKEQIELTKKFFGELSEEEKAQLQSLQNALDKLSNPTKKEGRETFASALGINEEELAKAQTELQDFQQAVNAVGTAINTIYELRLQTIENQKNSEIDAVNASALNEEEKKAKIAELNKKYAMEQYKIQKEQFEVNKAVQIVQAIIGGALGVINAISQLGPIAGAIAAIAVAATTAAQIGIISSQKPPPPPKFAKGVIGLRGPGTSTSDNIDAKLSRGESVMTAKATEAFSDQLAMMELAVGNKPNYQFGKGRFATGFIPTTDGGFSARQTAQSSLNSVAMAETVISAVRSIPPPVLEYSEFTRFTNGVNKSVQVSEL
jgi:hypothetical protein